MPRQPRDINVDAALAQAEYARVMIQRMCMAKWGSCSLEIDIENQIFFNIKGLKFPASICKSTQRNPSIVNYTDNIIDTIERIEFPATVLCYQHDQPVYMVGSKGKLTIFWRMNPNGDTSMDISLGAAAIKSFRKSFIIAQLNFINNRIKKESQELGDFVVSADTYGNKKGTMMAALDQTEVIQNWINTNEPVKDAFSYTITHTGDFHIVTVNFKDSRPQYFGRFFVTTTKHDHPIAFYRLLQEKNGIYLYRLEDDYRPEHRPRYL